MTKMQFFEESTKSAQNRLRLHEIDTIHSRHTFSPPAALRVRSGGDLVGGLPPGCRIHRKVFLSKIILVVFWPRFVTTFVRDTGR